MPLTKFHVITAMTATALSQLTQNFQLSTNSVTQPHLLMQQCPMIALIAEEAEATAEQKSELNQICQDTRSQIESILTPKQREVFDANLNQGKSLPSAISVLQSSPELKFSEQQWEHLKMIRQSTRTQVELKITWNQRQKTRKTHYLPR
ncbi:hypothetical protein ACX27_11775 [Nostoc piscinale CENA21]|uniref:Uncharacterized protein n=1 Tax=Nostoc piscinale CENA21 TaxID=224013 RepID=A0A0M4T3W2_9NOSO|nr:hypothetical protein [Nostoc piscinale]ALF53366.1 hypothetical protein ACX27_11775 [Nostoc piscinale CENA21]